MNDDIDIRECPFCDWYVASHGRFEIEAACPWEAGAKVCEMVLERKAVTA